MSWGTAIEVSIALIVKSTFEQTNGETRRRIGSKNAEEYLDRLADLRRTEPNNKMRASFR